MWGVKAPHPIPYPHNTGMVLTEQDCKVNWMQKNMSLLRPTDPLGTKRKQKLIQSERSRGVLPCHGGRGT